MMARTAPPDARWLELDLVEALQALADVGVLDAEVFDEGTHEDLFERDFGGWSWVAADRGMTEEMHLYRHAEAGLWALLPIHDLFSLRGNDGGMLRFDDYDPEDRRVFLDGLSKRQVLLVGTYAEVMAEVLVAMKFRPGVRSRRRAVRRARLLLRFPCTDVERAEAMLAEFAIADGE